MQNITTVALSRMVAQERALDVTAGNLANLATPGYHSEKMLFSDWLVHEPSRAEPSGGGTIAFTQDRATYRDTRTGPITQTANPLDLALGGDGYFTVQTKSGPRLTRAGHFELSQTGQVVDTAGNALLDTAGQPIQVSPQDGTLTVAGDGTVSSANGQIGRIGVVTLGNAQQLKAEGDHLYATDAATRAVPAPGIIQGAVEGSNVQATTELTRMMNDLREFQFASQILQGESDRQQAAIDKITTKRT